MGTILATFHAEGNSPDFNDKWINFVRVLMNNCDESMILTIFIGTLSKPVSFELVNFAITLVTILVETMGRVNTFLSACSTFSTMGLYVRD